MSMSDEKTTNQQTADKAEPVNPFFRLVVIAAGAFIVTVLASVATMFGDERAPLTGFLNNYGGLLMAGEVAATLVIGLLALITDRRQSQRRLQSQAKLSAVSASDSENESSPSRTNRPVADHRE